MYKFREATEDDFQGIGNLMTSKEELFYIYPHGEYPFTVEQLTKLAEVRTELTVVTEGDDIIGFANLYDHEPGELAFIGNVVVAKQHRGKGVGKEIILHMLRIAFEKLKLPEVRISVFNENTPAMLLYAGLGFVPYDVGERTDVNNKKVALVHMKIVRKA